MLLLLPRLYTYTSFLMCARCVECHTLLLPTLIVTLTTSFSFHYTDYISDLHSFPTRRSSDLCAPLLNPLFHHNGRDRKSPSQLLDRKSTRLNSSHVSISYAVFCLKK